MIMKEKIKRIKLWSQGKKQGPISIHLDLSNRCNLKCKFCWQRSHERIGLVDYGNEVSELKLLSIVKEASELGVCDWLISGGGEPMLRTSTSIKVMKAIKKNNMLGDIITNGTFFSNKDAVEVINIGWDKIRVSINGPNAKMHDFLVGYPGAFEKAIDSLKYTNVYKKKCKQKTPEIGFNTVINSMNYAEFLNIARLLTKVGGTFLNVQTIILYDDNEKKWSLNEKQRKEFSRIAKCVQRYADRHMIQTNIGEYINNRIIKTSNELGKMDTLMNTHKKGFIGSHCFEPWYLVTIRANGIVGSCRLFGDKGVSIHDKSLRDIWFGTYYNEIRYRLIKHDFPEYCKFCGANEYMENERIREKLEQ
jgi:MoaA/NifB/PqqE/SkfB family radical SAM enzyme